MYTCMELLKTNLTHLCAGIVDWISVDRKTRKILANKLAVNTPRIMLPDYIYRGRKGERIDWYRGVTSEI